MSKLIYKNIAAFHPGYYIKDIIEDMEITQSEFAKRLNTTDKTLSKLLSGQIKLSSEIAGNLSKMTGTSVSVWLNLQKKYEEKCCEIEQLQAIDKEIDYLSIIDYGYWVQLGVVAKVRDKREQVKNLLQHFQISSLAVLGKPDLLAACKSSIHEVEKKHVINANAWIQTGMNMAKAIECDLFNKKRLVDALPRLRALSLQSPEVFYPELKKIMASCGIALVALPYLPNSGINGAVKWLNSTKVLLLINDRGKDAGRFWFALFHEIKHIMQQQTTKLYLALQENNKKLALGSNNPEAEKDADDFARETLVPGKMYEGFLECGNYDEASIVCFSNKIGIAPSIVLGRLQHDGYLHWSVLPKLKTQYQII